MEIEEDSVANDAMYEEDEMEDITEVFDNFLLLDVGRYMDNYQFLLPWERIGKSAVRLLQYVYECWTQKTGWSTIRKRYWSWVWSAGIFSFVKNQG